MNGSNNAYFKSIINKAKNLIIFFITPIIFLSLLYVNSLMLTDIYLEKDSTWAQYDAEITSDINTLSLEPDQKEKINVIVKNKGTMTWISSGDNPINLSYHIIRKTGDVYLFDGERTPLPAALKPGDTVDLSAEVITPNDEGSYYLVLDMVHEGIDWFENKGSKPLVVNLEVTKK